MGFSFSNWGLSGDCLFRICIQQEVQFQNNPNGCASGLKVTFGEVCQTFDNLNSGFCYKDLVNCPCKMVTTNVSFTRLFNNNTGVFASIVLTGTNAEAYMKVVNDPPNTHSTFTFSGYINDCDGMVVNHTVTVENIHVGIIPSVNTINI